MPAAALNWWIALLCRQRAQFFHLYKNSCNQVPFYFVLGTSNCRIAVFAPLVRAGLVYPAEVGECSGVFLVRAGLVYPAEVGECSGVFLVRAGLVYSAEVGECSGVFLVRAGLVYPAEVGEAAVCFQKMDRVRYLGIIFVLQDYKSCSWCFTLNQRVSWGSVSWPGK